MDCLIGLDCIGLYLMIGLDDGWLDDGEWLTTILDEDVGFFFFFFLQCQHNFNALDR